MLGCCRTHTSLTENQTLPPSCANNQAPPFLDGERQAVVVGEGGRSGRSVSADSTFRNSVWAGEAGDRVCAQGGGNQGRFLVVDRQADRPRCARVSKGSETKPAEEGLGPVKGKEGQRTEEAAELELAGLECEPFQGTSRKDRKPPGRRVWKCSDLSCAQERSSVVLFQCLLLTAKASRTMTTQQHHGLTLWEGPHEENT